MARAGGTTSGGLSVICPACASVVRLAGDGPLPAAARCPSCAHTFPLDPSMREMTRTMAGGRAEQVPPVVFSESFRPSADPRA